MVFLGYKQGSKAYRLYDPQALQVVVFDKVASWEWESSGEEMVSGGGSHFTIEYEEHHTGGEEGATAADQGGASLVLGTGEATPPPSPGGGSPALGEGEGVEGR